jgi:flagellar hook-associated protein 2
VLLEILPDGSSLVDYGLDTNKEGEFTFNSDKFEELINQGGPEVEAFLNGKTKVEEAQLISSTIGYSSSEVNEINEDGSISTSTSKKPLSTDITINAGALVINDIRIGEIQLKAENTPAQNTQIVLEAINAKESETGVRAKLTGDNDQIMLINESGAEIDLVASSEAESFLGFKTSSEIGSSEYVPGIFSNLEEVFEELLVGEFSQLGLLESSLKSTTTKLDEERLNIIARLDSKYQIMEDQFAQYNVIINRFTTQFDALKQQIEFATANN